MLQILGEQFCYPDAIFAAERRDKGGSVAWMSLCGSFSAGINIDWPHGRCPDSSSFYFAMEIEER